MRRIARVKAAELVLKGSRLNQGQIVAEQAMPRNPGM